MGSKRKAIPTYVRLAAPATTGRVRIWMYLYQAEESAASSLHSRFLFFVARESRPNRRQGRLFRNTYWSYPPPRNSPDTTAIRTHNAAQAHLKQGHEDCQTKRETPPFCPSTTLDQQTTSRPELVCVFRVHHHALKHSPTETSNAKNKQETHQQACAAALRPFPRRPRSWTPLPAPPRGSTG